MIRGNVPFWYGKAAAYLAAANSGATTAASNNANSSPAEHGALTAMVSIPAASQHAAVPPESIITGVCSGVLKLYRREATRFDERTDQLCEECKRVVVAVEAFARWVLAAAQVALVIRGRLLRGPLGSLRYVTLKDDRWHCTSAK
jgi:hypothetical protein